MRTIEKAASQEAPSRDELLEHFSPDMLAAAQQSAHGYLAALTAHRDQMRHESHHDALGMHQTIQAIFEDLTADLQLLMTPDIPPENLHALCEAANPVQALALRAIRYENDPRIKKVQKAELDTALECIGKALGVQDQVIALTNHMRDTGVAL